MQIAGSLDTIKLIVLRNQVIYHESSWDTIHLYVLVSLSSGWRLTFCTESLSLGQCSATVVFSFSNTQ